MNESFFDTNYSPRKQVVYTDCNQNISITLLREDEVHPKVSGNKFRKLKYNLLDAKQKGYDKVLSFGGAYSNHIAALACASRMFGMESVGVIRGEELAFFSSQELDENPTLAFAKQQGMKFKFVSREMYRKKDEAFFLAELSSAFGDIYVIPEGGTNELAVKGCAEIGANDLHNYDIICVPVGTGGTMAGLIAGASLQQAVLGFAVLNNNYLTSEVKKMAKKSNWKINYDFHFGGYAKVTDGLVDFINNFFGNTGVPLDPIYTGKMMFGLIELIKSNYFPKNTRILAVHTGGLQGIEGFNSRRRKKAASEIKIS